MENYTELPQPKRNRKRRLNIVVIEDDHIVKSLIVGTLRRRGCRVSCAQFNNAQEAIYELWEKKTTDSQAVDMIFIDIFLNDNTNGLDILEYLQVHTEDIPIVIMSANFREEHYQRISKLKSKKPILLKKPFFPTDIDKLVDENIEAKLIKPRTFFYGVS